MSVREGMIAPVADRWPADAAPQSALEEVLLASHLLGADRAVANYGGGNTSAKGTTTDHAGRTVRAIWVKGSGSDLASMTARDFTPLRLDEVLELFSRQQMSDEDMVAYLARCQLDPTAPRSSIETLLHAFIPAPHVHHTHPDATNALACSRDGRALVAQCFGGEAAWIEYIRPGFELAKQVAEAVRSSPELRLVVLAKHGIVVWGESAREAYERTVEVCNRAAEFVNERAAGRRRLGGPAGHAQLSESERRERLEAILPVLRGALGGERRKVLIADLSPAACELADAARAAEVSQVGAACPDHLVNTKRIPLWIPHEAAVDSAESLAERIPSLAETYRENYRAYFAAHARSGETMFDPNPRVVVIQGLGIVAAGASLRAARLSRDLYHRAIEVMSGADALGGFSSLSEAESFAVEYWPLELYKLTLAPPPGELEGHVALVTGAAGGIGSAIVEALGRAGACVAGMDLDGEGAERAVAELGDRGLAVQGDVTSEEQVRGAMESVVRAFGGVDIVVSNAGIASSAPVEHTTLAEWQRNQSVLATGYFLVAREAFRVLSAQGTGGSVVFVASKNALVAGPDAAAYSSAKAAELHLARCLAAEGGARGIRVNTVNPDAVLQSSRIWDSEWRQERAAAYGIAPDQLEEHYRQRAVLKTNVLPQDVAEAVLHFASERRSGKSTGNVLNVDAGVTAAFPR
jgi:rhamnulose-1-phosphate aldolase/alcohol dehydrogenase